MHINSGPKEGIQYRLWSILYGLYALNNYTKAYRSVPYTTDAKPVTWNNFLVFLVDKTAEFVSISAIGAATNDNTRAPMNGKADSNPF